MLGILSSALLAVGLVRAADRLDPMSNSLPPSQASVSDVAPDSETDCLPGNLE